MTIDPEQLQAWPCMRLHAKGVILHVSASPNAKKTELIGWHDGALRVRLQAPPVDGAANDTLRKWLAKQLGLQQNQIELHLGATSRRKQCLVHGDAALVLSWLAAQTALQKV